MEHLDDAQKTMLVKFVPANNEEEAKENTSLGLPLNTTTVQMEACVNAILRSSPRNLVDFSHMTVQSVKEFSSSTIPQFYLFIK